RRAARGDERRARPPDPGRERHPARRREGHDGRGTEGRRRSEGSGLAMSVLVNKDSRIVVQGLTGSAGSFHAAQCKAYGTKIVAGVVPGKGGTTHETIPVFDTVSDAVRATGANVSMVFVPPPFAA